MFFRPLVQFAALCILCTPLQAHEFWIEAEDFTVPAGAPVAASFRNGETFAGSSFSYIPGRSVRFDMGVGALAPVPARLGDDPALSLDAAPEGLLRVVHETTPRSLTYTDWDKWVRFTGHKALDVLAAHRARGLPETGFREDYKRYAKALIGVGDAAGSDAPTGLFAEIVAEANPYVDDLSAGLPVRVLSGGAPRAGAQVEVFERLDGEVTVTILRADGEGRAVIPVRAGADYLLDAVSIEALTPAAEGDPVWRTHWAALTFAVPEA